MNDPAQSDSPTPGRTFDMTDGQLAADLKKNPGKRPSHYPVGELLDRHWEAVFCYARLCTDGVRSAGILTTAAFTRLFGDTLRQSGPATAWRPQLLVTARRIAAEWDADKRQTLLHPELQSGSGGERAADRLLPRENRRLLARAFQRLPEPSRCLLWHTEVEAEQLDIPAALLGLSVDDAAVELRRARERLREACLEVHRELAPEQECRRYSRMLDVSVRRGGVDLDPDLRAHMDRCEHCRHAADQLNQFHGELAVPLAESVLGWGARAYLTARAARASEIVEVTPTAAAEPADTGTDPGTDAGTGIPAGAATAVHHTHADRRPPRAEGRGEARPPAHKAPRRSARRRNLTLAVLTVSGLVLVPLVLWSALGSGGEDGTSGNARTGTASSDGSRQPGANPSWIGSGDSADGTVRGRLRNAATGLCIGLVGNRPVAGAQTELASCNSAASPQWAYESDGLLRLQDTPDLCLDSHLGYSVQLEPCTGPSKPDTKNVRYDLTLQGLLVPRWNQDLALTPTSTKEKASLVLKPRDDEAPQSWTLDTSAPALQMEVVNWDGDDEPAPAASSAPRPSTTPSPTASRAKPAPTPSTPKPTAPSTSPAYPTYPAYPSYPGGSSSCYYPNYCSGTGQYGGPGYGGGYGGYGYGSGYGY
ncbi:ricin-type beta-trefoil lectin domain protein [Streptomyces sp. SAS_270]|uniref:ricin-type beta-trefoil lectin domain protein n=1 Tax=Streptomyces sp. SAS_270 TaxID=3412748 RepID=UPI00403C1631